MREASASRTDRLVAFRPSSRQMPLRDHCPSAILQLMESADYHPIPQAMAWEPFYRRLEAQQASLGDLLQAYPASTLQSLTRYAYLVEAIHA
jgi:hypothetical protein